MADGKPSPPPLSPHEEGENQNTKPLYTTVLKSKINSQNSSTKFSDLQIPSSVQFIIVGSQKILLHQDSPKDEIAIRPSVIGLKLSQFAASSTTLPFNYQETPKVVFQKSDKAKLLAGMKHVLIAKFSHGRPSVLMMQNFLSNRKLIGTTHVSIFDAKHIFIEFEKFQDFVKFWIKQKGIIHGFPVRFFKWDELFDPNKESSIVPVWIHLPQLPLYLFEEGALLLIASALGRPLHLDGNNLNRNKISYATICIEFDILKAPPREVWIQFGESLSAGKHSGSNVGFHQKIVYGFMPPFCSSCSHIGHLSSVCKRFKSKVEVRDVLPVCSVVASEGLNNCAGKELLGVPSGFVESTSESEQVVDILEEGELDERLDHVAKRCYNKEVQGVQSSQTTTVSARVLERPAAENMGEADSEHVAGGKVDASADGAGRAVIPDIVESAVITVTEASTRTDAAEPTVVDVTGSAGEDAAAGGCIEELSPSFRQYSAGTAGELVAVGKTAGKAVAGESGARHNAAADSERQVGQDAPVCAVISVSVTNAVNPYARENVKSAAGEVVHGRAIVREHNKGVDAGFQELADGKVAAEQKAPAVTSGKAVSAREEADDADSNSSTMKLIGELEYCKVEEDVEHHPTKVDQVKVLNTLEEKNVAADAHHVHTSHRILSAAAVEFTPGSIAKNTKVGGQPWPFLLEKEDKEQKDKREQKLARDLNAIRAIRSYSAEEDLHFEMMNQKMAREVTAIRELYASQINGQTLGENVLIQDEDSKEGKLNDKDGGGETTIGNDKIYLSDEMCDIIPSFKCNSAPSSPSSRKYSVCSVDYSPTSKAVLAKYGFDTSPYFGCRWSEYE